MADTVGRMVKRGLKGGRNGVMQRILRRYMEGAEEVWVDGDDDDHYFLQGGLNALASLYVASLERTGHPCLFRVRFKLPYDCTQHLRVADLDDSVDALMSTGSVREYVARMLHLYEGGGVATTLGAWKRGELRVWASTPAADVLRRSPLAPLLTYPFSSTGLQTRHLQFTKEYRDVADCDVQHTSR